MLEPARVGQGACEGLKLGTNTSPSMLHSNDCGCCWRRRDKYTVIPDCQTDVLSPLTIKTTHSITSPSPFRLVAVQTVSIHPSHCIPLPLPLPLSLPPHHHITTPPLPPPCTDTRVTSMPARPPLPHATREPRQPFQHRRTPTRTGPRSQIWPSVGAYRTVLPSATTARSSRRGSKTWSAVLPRAQLHPSRSRLSCSHPNHRPARSSLLRRLPNPPTLPRQLKTACSLTSTRANSPPARHPSHSHISRHTQLQTKWLHTHCPTQPLPITPSPPHSLPSCQATRTYHRHSRPHTRLVCLALCLA